MEKIIITVYLLMDMVNICLKDRILVKILKIISHLILFYIIMMGPK
nr:MAG TPA: hypothetical protein [Caudoviricetes sp.]